MVDFENRVCFKQVNKGGGRGSTWEGKGWWGKRLATSGPAAAPLRCEHGVGAGLAFGVVRVCDGVDDGLGFFVADFWERGRVLLG